MSNFPVKPVAKIAKIAHRALPLLLTSNLLAITPGVALMASSLKPVCNGQGILIASLDEKSERAEKDKGSEPNEKSTSSADKPASADKDKDKADKSASKSENKGSKSDKSDKSDKSEKASGKGKVGSKKDDNKNKPEEKERDKKKKKEGKRGLFGGKHQEVVEPVAKEEAKKEDDNKTVFLPDAALVSVLKDLSRSVKDSEPYAKIEDPSTRMVVGLAQEIIDKALSDPKLGANRILPQDQTASTRAHLTAESWSSGDIALTEKFHGSLATVWAKRVDGLLTVTVAGDCQDRKSPDGSGIGEFIVIFTARSPIESGFDIQSQGNVNFWIGKLGDITVEADCIRNSQEKDAKEKAVEKSDASDVKKKRLRALSPLVTNRYRQHFELLARQDEERKQIALKLAEAHKAEAENKVADKTKGSEEAAVVSPAAAKTEVTAKAQAETKSETQPEAKSESKAEAKSEAITIAKNEKEPNQNNTNGEPVGQTSNAERTNSKSATTNNNNLVMQTPATMNKVSANAPAASNQAQSDNQLALAQTTAPRVESPRIESKEPASREPETTELPALRQPKNFILLAPEKVLAGQPLTVGFLDEAHNPESNITLSFNGVNLTTDQNGQAQYSVPEDETPGRSLNISLPSRPYEMPSVIEVLQPLMTPSQPVQPRLDKSTPLLSRHSTLVIDGHNFDGVAQNNRVIIDGVSEAQIVAASPVQLKVLLPKDLKAGLHTMCVSTQGMRSNPMGFELALLELHCEGKDNKESKDNASKLVVKVLGTASKVGLKIVNRSPELVKLNRSEEKLTSSGGVDNSVTLPLQRIKKGPVKVEAWLEL
jgi:IPT/TIG domain